MKKIITACLSLLSIITVAQNSFIVIQKNTSNTITPNTILDVVTTPTDLTTVTLDVQNISGTTNMYNVKRYDMQLHRVNATDTAEARFCFAGQCYMAGTFIGLTSLTLAPSQNTSTLGDYFSLDCDLVDATVIGYSLVKYKIYNENVAADSMIVTIRYNKALQFVGINEQKNTISAIHVVPNPAKDLANLSVVSPQNQTAKLSIINALGQTVQSQSIVLTAGKNNVPLALDDLSSGVYYVIVDSGTDSITRKLIITK